MKPHVPGRLHAQGLVPPRFETAAEVVRHLGCVQSQVHDMALWAVARRTTGLRLADLQAAFERGDFVRTHVLRPTWHFVDPADVHWLLSLTAPRIRQQLRSLNKPIGLTDDHLDRAAEVIVASLTGGAVRTRAELAVDLEGAGLPHAGQALAHVVMHAEIEALVVNGPMRGKQHTYRLLEPRAVQQTYDELLADVARRYGRGHGAFRDKDLAWWTSLTLTDSRRAVELAGARPVLVDGIEHWAVDDPVDVPVPRTMLLSTFDEYVSYARDPADYAAFDGTVQDVVRGTGLLMLDGRLAGTWTRAVAARSVTVSIDAPRRLTGAHRAGLEAEAESFGRFVDRDVRLDLPG